MMPTLATITQYSIGNSSQTNQSNKQKRIIQNGKEELKLSMSTDKMIIYIEKPNNSAHKHEINY